MSEVPRGTLIERAVIAWLCDLGYGMALNTEDPYRRLISIQLSTADLLGAMRAAIEAMREPTEAMLAAATRLNHPRDIEIWRVMVDAALSAGVQRALAQPVT